MPHGPEAREHQGLKGVVRRPCGGDLGKNTCIRVVHLARVRRDPVIACSVVVALDSVFCELLKTGYRCVMVVCRVALG